ncbi:hypothetical protein, unknown function [Leishmania mexicana MHOM/GT/2001/U1103]|uniref:Steroid 5-alpha reductase C-terminal domain-containing protein n=1 Tax=Leishmania mexicana (strain MHOM/GT/2001/U1103) TaxID=929439 RepID=E9AYZ4_LEIMU|nr:hypothetical protein, unknown function [Leishmania mexicana MHOM/GT/2001/U1103]CBZ28189.1 hypothetical protein, unknown function [Leishmania mexicana MHOM/GT/2001/U1103]
MESLSRAVAAVTATSLALSGTLMVVAALVLFIAAHRNDNYSWVDRSWSILPVVYTWIHVYYTHQQAREAAVRRAAGQSFPLSTATLFGLVITVWGCRLSFNFFRRGGYARGGEDYRWSYVHTWRIFACSPVVWTLFNFFIISFFQTWLLWAITLPVMQFPARPATAKEAAFGVMLLALVTFETICDEQQWRFQCAKVRTPRQAPYCYGFCVTGVFGYSRHLNVFCEASLWVMLAVAARSCGTAPMSWWQWSGCTMLALLILFSTAMITEKLTAKKYPGYAVYQSITPMLFPSLYSTSGKVLLALKKMR